MLGALLGARPSGHELAVARQNLGLQGKSLEARADRRTLVAAEGAFAASDGQVSAVQVNLFLALGGGWTSDVSIAD